MQLQNRDGGRDSDSLRIYGATTLPEMPLSKNRWRGKPIFYMEGRRKTSNFQGMLAGLLGAMLSRDHNLFYVLIGNIYDKMLLT